MSILDRIRKGGVPANATFRLTQEGREKLMQYGGDPKSRVLQALESSGTSNTSEIAQASGLSRGQVERIMPSLIRGGYIQPITSVVMEENE